MHESNVVNLGTTAEALRQEFIAWQCRLRKTAMREAGGRPSEGMRKAAPNTRCMMKCGIIAVIATKPAEITSTKLRGTATTEKFASGFWALAVMGNMALTSDHETKYSTRPTNAIAAYTPASRGAKKCFTMTISVLVMSTCPIKKTMACMPSWAEAGVQA